MKNLIKKFIPESLLRMRLEKQIRRELFQFYKEDAEQFYRYSSLLRKDTQSKHIAGIILNYHVIEKGLTMPDMKPGFGKAKLKVLIDDCLSYRDLYDNTNVQLLHAVGVIAEYGRIHKEIGFTLDQDVTDRIAELLKHFSELPSAHQEHVTKTGYFADHAASFDRFSNSRHSVRNFAGELDMERVNLAIGLAQNTPSSCNRQTSHVHIVRDREAIKKILELQKGSRGFYHLVDKLLIVTADVSVYQSADERNCAYVDGGMYAMNLMYSLHFHKIATCALNWCKTPDEDRQLRKLVPIPENEVVVIFIACGDTPDDFQVAHSRRNQYQDIISLH